MLQEMSCTASFAQSVLCDGDSASGTQQLIMFACTLLLLKESKFTHLYPRPSVLEQ